MESTLHNSTRGTRTAIRSALVTGCALALAACGGVVPQVSGGSTGASGYSPSRVATQGSVKAPISAPRPMAVRGGSRTCLAKLGQTGTQFEPLADQYFGGGCSNVNTVKLSSIRGDKAVFGLSNVGPLECDTASTFTAWARYGVDRAAQQILGTRLERIETMGTYSCRNVAGSAKRSAHATAQAIDVSAFVFADGRRISLAGDWDGGSQKERQFLRTVFNSACKRFGTVLGPDYNAAHRDHFHLERSGKGYCR